MSDLPSSVPPDPKRAQRPPADATGQLVAYERPARWQTGAAVGLGIVLLAVPLYLWRRPRSVTAPVGREAPDAGDLEASVVPNDDSASGALLGETRVLGCSDPAGRRILAGEACDHLAAVEKGFAHAILDAKDCGSQAGGGTIVYVADISFVRRRPSINVSLPKDGRSLSNAKAVAICMTAVRRNTAALSLDGISHAHARYQIAITVTYR